MPGPPLLVEPVSAGVLVSLFNRYVLSGACCTWCCGAHREADGDSNEEGSAESSSTTSVAPELGAITDADATYGHVHQGAHHVDAG